MRKFIKTTAIGGLIFLIPIVVLTVILKKAYSIMLSVAEPLDRLIPVDAIGGVALSNLLAVLCIFVACFLTGLLAKSKTGKAIFNWIDAKLSLFFPGYTYLKSLTSSFTDEIDGDKVLKPIMRNWMISLSSPLRLSTRMTARSLFISPAHLIPGQAMWLTLRRIALNPWI
jgi:hypothetical protein